MYVHHGGVPADSAVTTSEPGAAQPPRLERTSSRPLWAQLQDDISARIDAHEYDDAFPGEHALAEEYQVSRQTVRLALRSLREAGVLSAEKGKPPQVVHTISQPMGTLYSLFASVEASGRTQRSVVLALDERTDAVAATHLGLPATEPLVFLERLRLADDEPLAVDQVWLPARLARPLLDVDFTHTALYAEMFRRLGLHLGGGQEEIVAVTLNRTEAARLDTRIGAAAFALSRLGCHRGAPLEWRHTVIRGDRFRLLSRFSPGSGYTLHLGTQPSSSAAGADAPGQPGTNQFCGSENP